MTAVSVSTTVQVILAVAAGFVVWVACAFIEGAIFVQVPGMFLNSSGAIAGGVDGVGIVGGIVDPLVYVVSLMTNLHTGYSVVAVSMVPILLLATWVFQPPIAELATRDGFIRPVWGVSATTTNRLLL